MAFEDKLLDPRYSQFAQLWQPKAKKVEALSFDIYRYIDNLIGQLASEAGIVTGDTKAYFKEDNVGAVTHLFQNQGRGKELYEKLKTYKQNLLTIDPELAGRFGKNIIITTSDFDSEGDSAKDFTKTFFDGIPAIAASALLRMFENNIKIIENTLVTFCFTRIGGGGGCGYSERFWPLITQSSNYIKAGDNIEITAGIGSFSVAPQPKVIIDDKEISVDENGIVIYKFKSSKPGKYKKSVKIEYTKPDGTKESLTKNIEYTVIEEKK